MTKRTRRPPVVRVMKELLANRSRGYRITHAQMMDIVTSLADRFTFEDTAAELEVPVSLVVSLLQCQRMGNMMEALKVAVDKAMEMPMAGWVYAGGDDLFEGAHMVPAVGGDAT